MHTRSDLRLQVVRVQVDEPRLAASRAQYTDAFEARLGWSDGRTAEQWARHALEAAPLPVRLLVLVAQRRVLGLRLGPHPSPEHVLGWRIVHSDPGVVHVAASSPLVDAVVVARRPERTRVVLTTAITHRRRAGAVLWAVVAPVHRAVARYLLRRTRTGVT